MHIFDIHNWEVDISRAREIQQALRSRVSLKNSIQVRNVRLIAGADVSHKRGDKKLYGGVVLLSYPDLIVVEQKWVARKVSFPYIPGFLSFREAPVILEAFAKLHERPDAVIFDGQGIAHPYGLGLASHVALFLDLPSVGCAKSRLVGEYRPVGKEKKSFSWLEYQEKRVGAVLRTRMNVQPVFVSPGHQVNTRTAVELVLTSCRGYRLPETIRIAHRLVNQVREKNR